MSIDSRGGEGSPRDHVLHIKSSPLSRTKLEGLRAVGVEVSHLTPNDVTAALDGSDAAVREMMKRRVSDAECCVLDEGTGPRLATAVLTLRQATFRSVITTSEVIAEVSRGMTLGQSLVGGSSGYCEHVSSEELLRTLRRLGTPVVVETHSVARSVRVARDPWPTPFVADPRGYTDREFRDGNTLDLGLLSFQDGRVPPREMLTDGAHDRLMVRSTDGLIFLVKHLPTDELHLFESDEAVEFWDRMVTIQQAVAPGPWTYLSDLQGGREALETLLWHAMARDGGRVTLSRMPPEFAPLRTAVEEQWDRTVAAIVERTPHELVHPLSCDMRQTLGMKILKQWGVVPCEDPLSDDADPNLFRPTLATFRVARRYRSAPEVIVGARERWGGRPYQESRAESQLQAFVGESPPSSAGELDAWVRLLQTLPKGIMRTSVLVGMEIGWPRIEMDLAEVWDVYGNQADAYMLASKVPCLDASGGLRDDLSARLARQVALLERLRSVAQMRRISVQRTHLRAI